MQQKRLVRAPFILGTEFMMPFGFQKWLMLPSSRTASKSAPGIERDWRGTFFAGTRPGPLRPGTCKGAVQGGKV